MKKIKLSVLLMIGLYQQFLLVTQELQIEDRAQENVDQSFMKFAHLDDSFQFLQSQGMVHQSFQDFLLENLALHCIDNKEPEAQFEKIVNQAHMLVSDCFQNGFLAAMNLIVESNEDLNQIQDPIFIYVMSHKDDFMRPMMCEWVQEWEKTLDKDGFPLLNWCLNHVEIAKILVDLKADVTMQDQDGWAPLHYAAFKNCLESAQMHLDDGADINIQNSMKQTPLHIAAWQNHIDMVQMLIKKGADLNRQDSQGNTPLYTTEYRGIINILIAAGAHLHTRDLIENSAVGLNYRQFAYHAIRARKGIQNNQDSKKNQIALTPAMRQLFPGKNGRCILS